MPPAPSKDMAICIVLFNPCNTKRIIMNYHYMVNILKQQGLPIFTLELVFEGRTPEIPDAIHVRSDSYMFHKERLCRILETHVPAEYTKLAFLDGDILFNSPTWYERTSKLLEEYDVVQPFEQCHWLDLTYSTKQLTRKSVLFMTEKTYSTNYHPGFAWCMRRDWYRRIGFFDWAVSGSGDTLSTAAWLQKPFPKHFKSCPRALKVEYEAYCTLAVPRITYLKGIEIDHLYHGSRENRQYTERHRLLEMDGSIRELIRLNADGVYEWINPEKWNPVFYTYFKNRNDDDISASCTANRIVTS
jgi:hypothetical protein